MPEEKCIICQKFIILFSGPKKKENPTKEPS